METLLVTALTADAREFLIPVMKWETRSADPAGRALEKLDGDIREETLLLREFLQPEGGFTQEDFASIKKALILFDWIGSLETMEIEKGYGIMAGTIAKLAEHFSWLVLAAASLCESFRLPPASASSLETIARRLAAGVEEKGLGLLSPDLAILERSHLRMLIREGFTSAGDLRDAPMERLMEILPEGIVKALRREEKPLVSEGVPPKAGKPKRKKPEPDTEPEPAFLVIRRSEPGMVECRKKSIRLTPLPYRLLVCLAERPGRLVPYEVIDEYLWPDGKVERQQISNHRRSLVSGLGKVCGRKKGGSLIETFSGQGLMLNLQPSEIRLGD